MSRDRNTRVSKTFATTHIISNVCGVSSLVWGQGWTSNFWRRRGDSTRLYECSILSVCAFWPKKVLLPKNLRVSNEIEIKIIYSLFSLIIYFIFSKHACAWILYVVYDDACFFRIKRSVKWFFSRHTQNPKRDTREEKIENRHFFQSIDPIEISRRPASPTQAAGWTQPGAVLVLLLLLLLLYYYYY